MSDITRDFCPKCTTGTIRKFNRDEYGCTKCGKLFGPSHRAPEPERVIGSAGHVPRPGGNRCAG